MSKKDYIKFAKIFADLFKASPAPWPQYLCRFFSDFCDILAEENTLFDRDRFLKACGK